MSRLSRFLPKFLRGDKDKANNNAKAGDKTNSKIIFLDETEYYIAYKGGLKGQYIVEKVFEQLNLFEKDYFGLRFIDQSGQTHWLDVNKTLSSQFKACALPYTLYFGVKFYPADPCKLKEEITRYQFFLQVKRDILHGRLPVTFDEASELFAYAVQSELGDYESQQLPPGYVSEFQFVPNQTEQLEEQIAVLHRRLGGTVPATAELKFLDKVKWLDMYGVDLHPVMGDGNTEYFLGLTPTGIVVYKNKTKVGNYFWPRVTKVNYKAKVFIVKVRDKINDEHTYAFELMTKAACKHLWKCCVEHHAFFRLCQLGDAASRTSKPYRSTAKHRNSGRYDKQKNETSNKGREQPNVVRVQSRRQARRAMSDTRLNQADMMTTGIQYSEGHVTMVVTPEHVKGPRHRSLPDLKGRESPTSTKSAPWETNMDAGLYTSGRESPVSVTQSENVNHYRRHRESDSDVGYRKKRGYDSDGGHVIKHHHHYGNHSQYDMAYQQRSSRRSGYDSEPQSSSHRRKYFPSSRKGSDNESDASFTRRRRKEMDSGSESDISPKYTQRQRKAKSTGTDNFEKEWNAAIEGMYLPEKENRVNGALPLHSAPGGEARQKKMRRKRSKSPGSKHPPEELRQYIEFDLVEPTDEDQLKDIPYVNIETKAEPFKIKYSPKTRHRYRSPKRKAFNELEVMNKGGGGYISDDGPPPYKSPEQTPEPTHKQITKTGGYYSDSGSYPGSLQRNQNGPVSMPSSQANNMNSLSKHSKSMSTNIRTNPQFQQNFLFYEPHTSPRYWRQTMVHGYHGYHPPPTAVFKPIDSHDTRIPPVDNVNTHSVQPRQSGFGVPDPSLNLDLRGHFGDGDGHEPIDDDRNRDSGLNSSQGSSSTPQNTTPRTASRMYGTQDAIARLYSSPAGTRRTTNTSVNQSPSSANRNSSYNQYGTTNQSVSHNQMPPSSFQNMTYSRPSNVSVSTFQSSPYSQHKDSNYGRPTQNGGYNEQRHQQQALQTNYEYGRQTSKQNGFANHTSNMFYTQSNSTSSHYLTPSSQDCRSPSGHGNRNHGNSSHGNNSYGSNSHGNNNYGNNSHGNNNYSNNNHGNNSYGNSNYFGGNNYSSNKPRYEDQTGSRNTFQSPGSSQQYTQNLSSFGDHLDPKNSWKYVGNGDVGKSNPGYVPSSYSQQGTRPTGNQSPYKLSPASSPVKQGHGRSMASTASPNTQSRSNISSNINRQSNVMSPASLNSVRSPDSAISSLPSSSNMEGNRSWVGSNPYKSRSPSSSPQKYNNNNTETNFARVRTPAFGTSDIWTEI